MSGLGEGAARAGARRVKVVLARLEDDVRGQVPGDVRVEREGDSLVLSGCRLRARSLSDERLRAVGLLAKGGMR